MSKQTKNRNLFRLTRFLLLKLPRFLTFFSKFRQPRKSILIIKTDAIGDYVLFRNYIEVLKNSEKFNGYKIDILGNVIWKDLALEFDSKFINRFYFTNANELYYAPLKMLQLGWQLFKNNYQVTVQPSYTRSFINDGLAAFTAARQIIGFESDTEQIEAKYKIETDKFYTKLLQLPANVFFEFDRSKFFFQTVLGHNIEIDAPQIPTENKQKKGIVIFPGSGILNRNWGPDKFLALSKLIIADTREPLFFAGGEAEAELCNNLVKNLPVSRVYNMAGKTTLPQLVNLISSALLIVSNETNAVHIAAATKTKSVCILGGGHFGRFAPYTDNMENKPLCVHEKMTCFNCNWDCKFTNTGNLPFPCVASVGLGLVWQETKRLLS